MAVVLDKVVDKSQIPESTYTQPIDSKSRFVGVSLIMVEVGVMVGYGMSGVFRNDSAGIAILRTDIINLILMFMFITVGFGMLLNVYRFGNWLGTGSVILIMAVSIQLSPLLQKLFISIFLTGFGDVNANVPNSTVTIFWSYIANASIDVSVVLLRITFLSVISMCTLMTGIVGRVSITQIIKLISFYQIAWIINFYLLVYLDVLYQDHSSAQFNPYFFDMFGTTYVYLFAVFFGIPFSCLSKKLALPEIHPRNEFNRLSLLLSQIGSGFIIATFVFTSCFVIDYKYYGTSMGDNLSRFSILFGILGSIVGTFIGSALVGKGRAGFKEVLTGTISGGVVMGAAAPLIYNIGILIMIGTVTGMLCGVYMRVIHVKINKNNVKDVLGLFGPFCISALIGSMVVVPSALIVYYNRGESFPFTKTHTNIPYSLAGYQLIYVGISAGIGLVAGAFTALTGACDKDTFALASNSRYFLNEFGLYDLGEASKSRQTLPPPSYQQLLPDPNGVTPTPNGDQYYAGDSQQGIVGPGTMI